MKRLLFVLLKVKNKMNKKISGDLFFSALIFLMLAGTMIVGQIAYYHTSATTYIEIIQQNEAQTMKNMAVANNLTDQQKLVFNLGHAQRDKEKCIIWLNNQQKFVFSVKSWQDDQKR